jgi:DMSO reductase family type II enzyme heme b subunit
MLARKTALSSKQLLETNAPAWRSAQPELIGLTATPLDPQTSHVVQSWKDRARPAIKEVSARALHNGSEVAVRLEWQDSRADTEVSDNTEFPDGAALLFPVLEEANLYTMGDEKAPVNAWYWKANRPGIASSNVAHGVGTTQVVDEDSIAVAAEHSGGRWSVVFCRALEVPEQAGAAVQLSLGAERDIGVAIWEGSQGERGGIKAFSPVWSKLKVVL